VSTARTSPPKDEAAGHPEHLTPISLTINGDRVRAAVPPRRTLMEFLRYDLALTGSKQGCDKGDCGACTVLMNGRPVLSCITLAVEAEETNVETVESLARGPELHPLQETFVRNCAAQCGFCTPGMLMSAKALLEGNPKASRDDIKLALSGNLCRCTGYTKIFVAVEEAAEMLRAEVTREEG